MKHLLFCAPLLSGCLFVTGILSKECADGFVDQSEECDDANQDISDSCDAECLLENRFTVPDINGANANNARFAVYAETIEPRDSDNDAIDDVEITQLDLFITNEPDPAAFCAAFAADPFILNNRPDLEAVRLLFLKVDALGSGGFSQGESVLATSDGLSFGGAVLFPSSGQVFVGADMVKRVAGETQLFANNSAVESNDGSASFSIASDGKMEGQLNVTLTADRSGIVEFDTIEDFIFVDGENDFFEISVPLQVEFRNVVKCE